MVTYYEEVLLIKLLDPSMTCFCEFKWHIKYFISPLSLDQWPPNMAKWWLSVGSVFTRGHVTNYRHIPSITVLMVTRIIGVVTYLKEFSPRNSHNLSMRWSCKIPSQIKSIISPPETTHVHQTRQGVDYVNSITFRDSLWPVNGAGCLVMGGGSARWRLSY